MLREYYLLIKQALESIPTLKQVDWYTGQFDQNGEQTQIVDSAAFVEFDPIDMLQKGGRVQEAVISFTVYLVHHVVLDGDRRYTDATINHLGVMNEIYQKLTHYSARLSAIPAYAAQAGTPQDVVVVNSLVRTSIAPIQELSNLLVTQQGFQGTWIDQSAHPDLQLVNANLLLNPSLKTP
jgi:hypothetical protein